MYESLNGYQKTATARFREANHPSSSALTIPSIQALLNHVSGYSTFDLRNFLTI
jgi:hypothetical protein